MNNKIMKALEIKKDGYVVVSGEEVLGFMEEMYDDSPFIQTVYENLHWNKINREDIKTVKVLVLKYLNV